ncbi:acid phosphatase/Vanadium-dependent haloperoxidase [Aulographum hederae CBS 113979]|uniref:Acid phosphatase/Vanadium-dependent haloperoxidase n=1 Tax=Aulographum hederae CBS 113979 TaxID=1176131 RepID=A0A6G1H1F9_9PEZI|nr:acid phosphatase/Vanadium-dependent haloperoxidase [Aulographum hederae CBS 113979]
MNLFSRRQAAPVEADTTATTGTPPVNEKTNRFSNLLKKRESADVEEGTATGRHHRHHNSLSIRPTFGQWIKMTWVDLLTMVIMGAIGLGVYNAKPAPTRSFPVYFRDREVVYPQFAYPLRHEIIPIYAAALMASLIPIFIFLVMQVRIRSFWDLNNAIMGLLYSLISAAVFQVFIKWLIGGLRPHFLAVCAPAVPDRLVETGNGFDQIMYDRSVCTGNAAAIDDALESMPSGHTTAAFAGFVFLYLYLNAKMKVFSNHHPAMWKLIVLYSPILGACLIGGALTIDEYHNWYDILAGAVIGTVFAFSAYRMVYASVWDFRFNHVPLVRDVPFHYGEWQAGFNGFHSAMFSRRAGWGAYERGPLGGAPFDSAGGVGGIGGRAGDGWHGGAGRWDREGAGSGVNRHSIGRKPVGAPSPAPGAATTGVGHEGGVRGEEIV